MYNIGYVLALEHFETQYKISNLFYCMIIQYHVNYSSGWEAIHHAANKGHFKLLQFLIEEQHAEPTSRDSQGSACYFKTKKLLTGLYY